MRILVSGSSGLVGSALLPALRERGHDVACLVRRRGDSDAGAVYWDPAQGEIDAEGLRGTDAAVHLAGESIAAGRWSAARKKRILESRTRPTRLLAESLAALEPPPSLLVTASAIGIYGERGDEILREASPPGEGFLADVCVRWEAASEAARERGIRVVPLRIGMVLACHGGALAKMLPPFRLGLGGVVGSGRQWVSWITLDDLVGVILHVLENDEIAGPTNAVAPTPVTNRDFTRQLGRAIHRPTVLPLPAFAARLALGEMADELLLTSARVDAGRLVDSGYVFQDPTLAGALKRLLGGNTP